MGNYEKAIDLYIEAELPNNAIAVCKKIVRNMPMWHTVYLRMGQIRGKQSFLTDARQNFLTYAERMQAEGKIDEGLRALGELADLAPEDVDIRLAIAAQMQQHGRTDDAIVQLQAGYRQATQRAMPTAPFEKMLAQLGAEPDLSATADLVSEPSADTGIGQFGDIELGAAVPGEEREEAEFEVGGFQIAGEAAADQEEEEEEEAPLPLLGDEDEEASTPLPPLDEPAAETGLDAASFGERDLGEREDAEYVSGEAELPEIEVGDFSLGSEEGAPAREAAMEEARSEAREAPPSPALPDPMGHEALAGRGDIRGAMDSLRKLIKTRPDDIALRQRLVEYAFRLNDESALVLVWLELADALERTGQSERARPVYQQALSVDPENARARAALGQAARPAAPAGEVASSEDYVDLGSLILDDEEEKTTRFVVAYEEPSGDEQADFAKMLSQFKAKVAENLSADDVKAHQDLGTAYKEMGLIDEAVSEFQQALRASTDHLPTYELLGQCFMEKGEPDAAVRTLKRALEAPFEVEDELLGIYYWLGRAHQELGNNTEAVEFYDRVFSLDINFTDVTERLRTLR